MNLRPNFFECVILLYQQSKKRLEFGLLRGLGESAYRVGTAPARLVQAGAGTNGFEIRFRHGLPC